MQEATLVVRNKVGLHARPAATFVKLANKFKSEIVVSKLGDNCDREVNAKSILSILTLGVNKDAEVCIRATGLDEEEAIAALSELIESNFGEEDAEG